MKISCPFFKPGVITVKRNHKIKILKILKYKIFKMNNKYSKNMNINLQNNPNYTKPYFLFKKF